MGRHGGGSRSGGSRRSSSRSRSGSRRGGSSSSSVRSSNKPFSGSYNRSYYYKGHYYPYYTTDANFGIKSAINFPTIVLFLIFTVYMFMIGGGLVVSMTTFGEKVTGNPDRIQIIDNIDILSNDEENDVIDLLHKVYDKSGMPVTVITDDFEWKENYYDIETYSEELYYGIDMDEDAMVILFTLEEDTDGFVDWEYDMYCGDDTIKCLSDKTFDDLIETFQKSMAKQDLYYALDYSWNSVMNDLAKTSVNPKVWIPMTVLLLFCSIFYILFIHELKHKQRAKEYFSQNPHMLDNSPTNSYNNGSQTINSQPLSLYSECPNCGAPNTEMREICAYCGSVLKISGKNVTLVKPQN